jgi:glyoxylase-like metal-dependent hydrolase (beta-lactamase superfamily II)
MSLEWEAYAKPVKEINLPSGRTQCWLLSDGRGPSIVDLVFADVDPDELAAARGLEPEAPDGPYNCLLVRGEDAVVLVDTGLGAAEHPLGGEGGRLWGELARVGTDPADIDLVVISHGHLDHIGGLVRGGEPAFPRARYLISDGEWEYWTSPTVLDGLSELVAAPPREQLPPLEAAGVLETFTGELQVAADIRLIPAPGHTPAHVAVEVGAARGFLYAVDAFLHPLQYGHPAWGRGMDLAADTAVATRHALLELASEREHAIGASHWDVVLGPPPQGR